MTVTKPVRMKRKLRGADGGKHPHVKNTQDFTPTVKTPAQRREMVRYAAGWFIEMLRIWGAGTKAQRAASAAAELVILEVSE